MAADRGGWLGHTAAAAAVLAWMEGARIEVEVVIFEELSLELFESFKFLALIVNTSSRAEH